MRNDEKITTANQWTSAQAYALSVICLLVGLAGGWFIRGSQAPGVPTQAASAGSPSSSTSLDQPTPEQLRHMADKQAAPLMEALQKQPNDAELLAKIGNIYYDTQQYPVAIDFYQRSLKSRPNDASVRTDMATAYWYAGSPDLAISEFNRALADEPNKANALFNLGIVQWQGKMDIQGAVATWQRLLETNPNYEAKDKVLDLIAQVKKHANLKSGMQAKVEQP
jgi:cytochrome c-type biogenesis protein CcmH/NrfG